MAWPTSVWWSGVVILAAGCATATAAPAGGSDPGDPPDPVRTEVAPGLVLLGWRGDELLLARERAGDDCAKTPGPGVKPCWVVEGTSTGELARDCAKGALPPDAVRAAKVGPLAPVGPPLHSPPIALYAPKGDDTYDSDPGDCWGFDTEPTPCFRRVSFVLGVAPDLIADVRVIAKGGKVAVLKLGKSCARRSGRAAPARLTSLQVFLSPSGKVAAVVFLPAKPDEGTFLFVVPLKAAPVLDDAHVSRLMALTDAHGGGAAAIDAVAHGPAADHEGTATTEVKDRTTGVAILRSASAVWGGAHRLARALFDRGMTTLRDKPTDYYGREYLWASVLADPWFADGLVENARHACRDREKENCLAYLTALAGLDTADSRAALARAASAPDFDWARKDPVIEKLFEKGR
jgi:hypothetical protein